MPQGALAIRLTPPLNTPSESQTAYAATGATGTLTAAAMLSHDILRSGPTAAFTDTTDTAANVQAAWLLAGTGNSFVFTYQNTTAFAATLAGGTGVTLSGNLIVPANTWARFLVVWTGANTLSMYNVSAAELSPLPIVQYTTSSVTTGSIGAGIITGSQMNVWNQTGNTPGAQLVRTAAQMLADTPNGRVGMSVFVRIINSGTGTLTVTADSGATVTLTGTMTLATLTFRDFMLTFNTATTATLQQIGIGTNA